MITRLALGLLVSALLCCAHASEWQAPLRNVLDPTLLLTMPDGLAPLVNVLKQQDFRPRQLARMDQASKRFLLEAAARKAAKGLKASREDGAPDLISSLRTIRQFSALFAGYVGPGNNAALEAAYAQGYRSLEQRFIAKAAEPMQRTADALMRPVPLFPVEGIFPDPRTADSEGVVTEQVPLIPETLYAAYDSGIFPWTDLKETAGWYALDPRGVLDFTDLKVHKRLSRYRKGFEITMDRDFERVIRTAAEVHAAAKPGQVWITRKFIETYTRFHRLGHAHSVEAWQKGELVGGIYGVHVRGAFFGESMFHIAANAGKLALVTLIDHLKARGLTWMDLQMVTDAMEELGAKEITREEHIARIKKAHENPTPFYAEP